MCTIQAAIDRTIKICKQEVLKDRERFLNMLEDLVPELVEERNFLDRIYDQELGRMIYDVYKLRENPSEKSFQEIENYLCEKLEVNESCQKRVFEYFKNILGERTENPKLKQSPQKPAKTVDKFAKSKSIFDAGMEAEKNKDTSKAVELYRKLTDGSVYERQAKYRLGKIYEAYPEMSFPHFLRAAELGDVESMLIVGCMYEYGAGVAEDKKKAFGYYDKAAAAGHKDALYFLGCFYNAGTVGARDRRKAFALFKDAACKGQVHAMRNLGLMYENGEYVSRDYEKAKIWYKKAMDSGLKKAFDDYRRVEKK